jgi:hypothetical protein
MGKVRDGPLFQVMKNICDGVFEEELGLLLFLDLGAGPQGVHFG